MFKKLRNEFLLLNIVVTTLVMLTAFSVVYLTTYKNITAENERKLNTAASSFIVSGPGGINLPSSSDDYPDLKSELQVSVIVSNRVTSEYSPSFVLTTDDKGTILTIDSLLDMPPEVYVQAARIAWDENGSSPVDLSDRTWIYQRVALKNHTIENGRLPHEETVADQWQISFLDVTETQKTLDDLLITFLFVGVGMLLIICCISFLYANRSIQPISTSWEKQKRFVADASHELKTPLATIMTNCDVLEANEEETIKSQKKWLEHIKIGAGRMNGLVNSLLTLARVEGMDIQTERQPFDMTAMVCGVMQAMEAATTAKNLRVDCNATLVGDVCGYEQSVRQVFNILYENAVKYADEDGRIEVSVSRVKKAVQCTVRNTGKGISPKDLPRVFDRFYRADDARSNDESSYGLGLAIAKSITEQVNGSITARSEKSGWTEFVLTFEA